MKNEIFIQFNNAAGKSLESIWDIDNSGLAKRWANNFARALQSDSAREQRFFGWNWSGAFRQEKAADLISAIATINSYSSNAINFSEEEVRNPNQETLNSLHHKFELFMGQSWNRAEFALNAPLHVQIAIRELNDYVHDLEYAHSPEALEKKEHLWLRGFQFQLVPYEQYPFNTEELNGFTFEAEPGDLVTNYCQLGKTWVEAYINEDEHISLENITPLRFFSSGFICNLHLYSALQSRELTQNIRKYIEQKSTTHGVKIDPFDPKNALGHITLARPSKDAALRKLDSKKQVEFFSQSPKITKIGITFNDAFHEKIFSHDDGYLAQKSGDKSF